LGAACSVDLAYLEDGPPLVEAGDEASVSDLDAGASEADAPEDAPEPDALVLADDGGDDGGDDGEGGDDSGDAADVALDGPPSNLIVNPGFEDGTTGWYAWQQTVATSPDHAHSGSFGGCLQGPSPDQRGPAQDVTAVVMSSGAYTFSAWAWWAPATAEGGADATVDGGAADATVDGDVNGDADAMSAGDASGTVDAGAAATTAWEDLKVRMVAVCADGSAHFTACVNGILAPEGTWTQLAGICSGSILALCGDAGPADVEIYFETADPGIVLCVDDVSLIAK
jgi:hypothetical protein